jgi:hypothetical protein
MQRLTLNPEKSWSFGSPGARTTGRSSGITLFHLRSMNVKKKRTLNVDQPTSLKLGHNELRE